MMKKIFVLIIGLFGIGSAQAQDYKWALGFYSDMLMESPAYEKSFGVQGRYDLDNHSSIQAQVHGRSSFVAVGADYLFHILDKKKSNFNVFLGPGLSEEFISYKPDDVVGPVKVRDEFFKVNGQLGVSYYFEPVQLSIYTGYKVKYDVSNEKFEPNFLMLGLRYHLW